MKHENNLYWFDFLRGISALIVLSGHVRALTFLTFDESGKSADLFGKFFYFITGFSHQAVIIFFVLSGFFIIQSIHKAVIGGKWSFKTYAFNRLTRLWVVLLPALLLTLLLDKIGLAFFASTPAYSITMDNIPGINPTNKLGLLIFLGNLSFLQTIFVPTFGSNVALWSLANEFWYYTLFPLFFFSIRQHYSRFINIIMLLLGIGCAILVGRGIVTYFFIWLAGGLTYLIIKNQYSFFQKNSTFLTLLFLFVSELLFVRFELLPQIWNDTILTLTAALFFASLSYRSMSNLKFKTLCGSLSNISYSVYLTHVSFAVLVTSWLFGHKISWSFLHFFYYLLTCSIVLTYCIVIYFLFEKNTPLIKRKIIDMTARKINMPVLTNRYAKNSSN